MNIRRKKLLREVNRLTMGEKRVRIFLSNWARWSAKGYAPGVTASNLKKLYGDKPERFIAEDILKSIERGQQAAEGFRGWLPEHIVSWLAFSEQSSNLRLQLERIEYSIKWRGNIKYLVMKKLGYALILMLMTCSQLALIVDDGFIDLLSGLKDPSTWSTNTKMMVNLATGLRDYFLEGMVIATISTSWFGWCFYQSCFKESKLWRWVPLRVWYREIKAVQALEKLCLLVENHQSWSSAAVQLQRQVGMLEKKTLAGIIYHLNEGKSVAASLASCQMFSQEIKLQLIGYEGENLTQEVLWTFCHEHYQQAEEQILAKLHVIQWLGYLSAAGVMLLLLSGLYAFK